MDFKVDQYVYWVKNVRGDLHERVGRVVAVLPPYCSPNVTNLGKIVSDKYPPRSFTTYLVLSHGAIFYVDCAQEVPEGKIGLLETQPKPTVKRGATIVDKSDRLKIKKWFKKFGVEFLEADRSISILDSKKRLWFSVSGGIETLSSIENITLV